MKCKGVWEQVEALLQEGKGVQLSVSPGAELKPVPRGKPRFRDPLNPYAHYKTPRRGYAHPKCLVCKKELRKDDVEVCSEACRAHAEEWLEWKLAHLRGETLPPLTRRAPRGKRTLERGSQ
jgi:hypothetical protein